MDRLLQAPYFEKYPQLHGLFNEATKLAGAAGTKGTFDVAVADDLLAKIDELAAIFWDGARQRRREWQFLGRRVERAAADVPENGRRRTRPSGLWRWEMFDRLAQ